ncbi:MAG: DNA primase [Bacteroidetes bacterium]|nr:MAG: DNA primase [Bacteroidota bacterium]
MIKPEVVQQIQQRIDIIDVLGDFIKLKKRGTNYLGLCPFHGERTPSFTVSPVKEIYKCFGCGKSGNTITFLMEHEKFSYVEALKWLAKRYGIEIEEEFVTDEAREQYQQAESLYVVNKFAQTFYAQQLLETEEGINIAKSYLLERGFTNDLIQQFQVGYCPTSGNAFATAALAQQFSKDILLKTGMVVERNGSLVDNYRGRIIFPVTGVNGKVIGFGARVIGKADKAPKYINTPENEVYVKSKILYGLFQARQAIDKADECLLVEGYTDVTALHGAGIENAVASGGTSLTVDQLRLIKKYTDNLTIVYDGDAAGVKAALRGLGMALEERLNVRLVLIPDNEDPDSYVKKLGKEAFQQFIQTHKKDIILFQLEVLLKEAGNDLVKRNEVVNQVAESISKLSQAEDFTKMQGYVKQSAVLLKVEESDLLNLVNKIKRATAQKEQKKPTPAPDTLADITADTPETEVLSFLQENEPQQRNIIRLLLEHGQEPWGDNAKVADYIFMELDDFALESETLDAIYLKYRELHSQHLQPDTRHFLYNEGPEVAKLVSDITVFVHEVSKGWEQLMPTKDDAKQAQLQQDVVSSVHLYRLRMIKKFMKQTFVEIEQEQDEKSLNEKLLLYTELKKLERESTQILGSVIVK